MQEMLSLENRIDDVKVIVLGSPGAGKSLIISRLMNDGKMLDDAEEGTIGISIKEWMCQSLAKPVRVSLWDFGRQAIQYSLYRLFLSPQAVYVVVLDTQDDSQDEQARFWLNTIRLAAPDAPVMLVLNKTDLNPGAAIDATGLSAEYPNLEAAMRLSAWESDQATFRDSFTEMLLPLIQQRLARRDMGWRHPEAWYSLKETLDKKEFRCMSGWEFGMMCTAYQITMNPDARWELAKWCCENGSLFCFRPGEGTDDFWICRPEWILQLLSGYRRINALSGQNGVVSHEELSRFLHMNGVVATVQAADTEERIPVILAMLRSAQLSFRFDESTEFIPMLCKPDDKPMVQFYQTDARCLECRIEFEYLPTSVIHSLLPRFSSVVDKADIWFTGAHFLDKHSGISALVHSRGNTVILYVRSEGGAEPRYYLEPLAAALEDISVQQGLRITDRSIVYKQGGLEEHFPYEMVMRSRKRNERNIYSPVFNEVIPISRILKQPGEELSVARELMDDLVRAFVEVQSDARYLRGSAEERNDMLNRFLNVVLQSKGYVSATQTMHASPAFGGQSISGADLVLMDENRTPLTMIDTMIVRTPERSTLRYWDARLNKLLVQYGGSNMKLPVVFLISYAQCGKDSYSRYWDVFCEHMRWFEPDRMDRSENSYEEISPESGSYPFIRAAKCAYHFRGNTITVVHYFVRIPENTGTDSFQEMPQPPAGPRKEPAEEKAPPELLPQPEPAPAPPGKPDDIPAFEYRVVFLGDSEAGKSQLLARVMDPEKGLTEFDGMTTPGICIEHRTYTMGQHRVRVNYWDFGGQEVLHSLHRMFLSLRTLYVIVLNTRNDNHDAQADFWMRYVQAYAYGAPVLFVLNKIDQNPRAKLNLPVLNRHFGTTYQPEDVLRICAVDKDHEKFRRAFTDRLTTRIARCIDFSQSCSPQTARIRAAVEERKESACVIRTDTFRDICEDAGLMDEDAHEALMVRFNQAGILVYFGTDLKLLLDPRWITKAIYILLEKQEEIAANGFVLRKKLESLCRRELGDSEHARFILEVMRYYGLSYLYDARHPGQKTAEDREFIPMLCQQEEPPEIEAMTQADNTVEMHMYFEYLPTGVLYQLMVAFKDNLDTEMVWRSGAHFKFGALVDAIVRRDGNVMNIYVHYESKAVKEKALEHMKDLMKRISDIAERGKSTAKLLEIKLSYMVGTIMEYFDYKRLQHARKSKVEYVASAVREGYKIHVGDILAQEDGQEARTVDKLLQLSLKCCEEMQGNQTYWFRHKEAAADRTAPKMDEDARTRLLKFKLSGDFEVVDQARWGASASGVKPGELDLKIDTTEGDSLAILEALNITGSNKASQDSWKEHLNRMINSYNKNGLRHLLLVSYLDCGEDKLSAVQDAYLELLRTYAVPNYGVPRIDPDVLPHRSERIQIVRADYSGGAGDVSVYHFLVHIPRYTGQAPAGRGLEQRWKNDGIDFI